MGRFDPEMDITSVVSELWELYNTRAYKIWVYTEHISGIPVANGYDSIARNNS